MKDANPVVSVVVPTLGRAQLARTAVDSVLLQTGNLEVEVIVSNNGGDPATRALFGRDEYAHRIHYVETSKVLPMTEHWEWATQFAKGEFLMVLPDRRLLKQGALVKLVTALRANPSANACCCPDEWLYRSGRLVSTKSTARDQVRTAAEILRDFEGGHFNRNELPLGLNSLVRNSLIKGYRAHKGPYFAAFSPDFRSAFNYLLLGGSVLAVAEPLIITTGFDLSNGGKVVRGDRAYQKSLGSSGSFRFIPARLEGNVWASIYEDFLRAKNELVSPADYRSLFTLPVMRRIYVEEVQKLVAAPRKTAAIKRYCEARRVLSSCGWTFWDELKTMPMAASACRQFVPNSIKSLYRTAYSVTHRERSIYAIAGFAQDGIQSH